MLDATEDNPKLQAVVSLLSTGPVGVGDRIGYTDVDLVHRSVDQSSYQLLITLLSTSRLWIITIIFLIF